MNNKSQITILNSKKSMAELGYLSVQSQKWFEKQLRNLKQQPLSMAREIIKERSGKNPYLFVGGLYMFFYDAKGKADLPYWDKFPLVLILDKSNDGFTGLNLHYIPPPMRRMLLQKLIPFSQMTKDNEIRRVRVSYDILKASNRLKEFRPCLKKYLNSHVVSQIAQIKPNEWETAIYLPVQLFQKEKTSVVWAESVEEIKKHA